MKVTHLYHSGFYMELQRMAFLFDYYRGPLPKLNPAVPLFVFASHVHADHFSFSIFTEGVFRAHPHVRYVLSKDIRRKYNRNFFLRMGVSEEQYGCITFLKAEEEYRMGGECRTAEEYRMDGEYRTAGERRTDAGSPHGELFVRTLASTDAGVAFLVEAEGKRIYHAGDLNWWSFAGAPDEEERRMERDYKRETAKLSGIALDVACLPLDARQGERFYLGFDWFMRHVEVRRAFPMHNWGEPGAAERLLGMPCSEPYRDRIIMTDELIL